MLLLQYSNIVDENIFVSITANIAKYKWKLISSDGIDGIVSSMRLLHFSVYLCVCPLSACPWGLLLRQGVNYSANA